MAKRFTDTDKWKRTWFRELPLKAKLTWGYLCDQCDHAGIWIEDFPVMKVQLGFDVTQADFKTWFEGKVVRVEKDKWLITTFYEFQYADAKDSFKAKESARKTLIKYGFNVTEDGKVLVPNDVSLTDCSELLPNSPEVLGDTPGQSMDSPSIGISIGIGISKKDDSEKNEPFDLESLCDKYPRRKGIAEGKERLKTQIRTKLDYDNFARAIENYIKDCEAEGTEQKFMKYFSSFVGTQKNQPWKEYVNLEIKPKKPNQLAPGVVRDW